LLLHADAAVPNLTVGQRTAISLPRLAQPILGGGCDDDRNGVDLCQVEKLVPGSSATCLVLRPTQQLRSLAMFAAIRRASSRVCR